MTRLSLRSRHLRPARAHGSGARCTAPLESRQVEFKLGYGIAMWGNRFTGTPEATLRLSDGQREYGLGWRLGLAQSGPVSIELGLEATRSEPANDDSEPTNALMLRGSMRF